MREKKFKFFILNKKKDNKENHVSKPAEAKGANRGLPNEGFPVSKYKGHLFLSG